MDNLTVLQWIILIIIILAILTIATVGLIIFSRFGKRVLDKLQSQHDIFTKFMDHARKDSEAIRQEVFRHSGALAEHSKTLNNHSKLLTELQKKHAEQNY
ncbi:hypothetical protein [Plebeiibacterium sediminum]|uniref:Uncharacterized protein n=1 Tax=Plebeiibacterium sediminum TaxID=2992112 RepID=A0AAE3M1F6_9BACT|nr:hypothetical protein [Plebeiobacterium sediminum]MCW3784944.1 hypothetical protein [Plebeiobacterium sediminum]